MAKTRAEGTSSPPWPFGTSGFSRSLFVEAGRKIASGAETIDISVLVEIKTLAENVSGLEMLKRYRRC